MKCRVPCIVFCAACALYFQYAYSADAPKKPAATTAAPSLTATNDHVNRLAAGLKPDRLVTYKKIGDRELKLHVFEPKNAEPGEARPCFLVIHGGGWTGGAPPRMYPFAAHFAARGMVGVSMEYRLVTKGSGVTPFDCVRDGRSAVRYLKTHSKELGIDPAKIVVSGGSAGGHVALATALFDGVDDPQDDKSVSSVPAALVPLFPVIDTSPAGYGNAKCGPDWKQISPVDRVRKGLPPMLVFHGTGDTVTPFAGAKRFDEEMKAAGNRCELVVDEGGVHGYLMRDAKKYDATMKRTEEFLRELKLMPE